MMSDKTGIEWTDATWNPLVGCERISPGCSHCYAKVQHDMRHDAVLRGKQLPVQYARPFEVVQLRPDRLEQPIRWKKPRRVFVNSLSDLFHQDVPDAFIVRVFAVMALAKQHTFQILTKRPQRMHDLIRYYRPISGPPAFSERVLRAAIEIGGQHIEEMPWPPPNVWLGVSVENQHFADERIPLLLQTPAAIRFISAEPLLEKIDLHKTCSRNCPQCRGAMEVCNSEEGGIWVGCPCERLAGLSWVIVGGESGPKSRPFDLAWAREIVRQCAAAKVACFVKQIGALPIGQPGVDYTLSFSKHGLPLQDSRAVAQTGVVGEKRLILRDKKGGDPSEWPEDLRVRQFPEARG